MCAYMVGTERARVRYVCAYITRSNVSLDDTFRVCARIQAQARTPTAQTECHSCDVIAQATRMPRFLPLIPVTRQCRGTKLEHVCTITRTPSHQPVALASERPPPPPTLTRISTISLHGHTCAHACMHIHIIHAYATTKLTGTGAASAHPRRFARVHTHTWSVHPQTVRHGFFGRERGLGWERKREHAY